MFLTVFFLCLSSSPVLFIVESFVWFCIPLSVLSCFFSMCFQTGGVVVFQGGVVGGWCVFSKIESGELFPVFLYHSQPFFCTGRSNELISSISSLNISRASK